MREHLEEVDQIRSFSNVSFTTLYATQQQLQVWMEKVVDIGSSSNTKTATMLVFIEVDYMH